jgi:hypothetical protein
MQERVAGLGSCPFCPANRTRAAVAAAARGTLVVKLQKEGAAVSDAAGDGGLSRDYEGFAVVEGACPAGRLVQEVSRPDSPGQCERDDALRVGRTYSLSGQCEGKTFFLDPCGCWSGCRGTRRGRWEPLRPARETPRSKRPS